MSPVREGDVPAYFAWDDGSEYEVWGKMGEDSLGTPCVVPWFRRFRGPLFFPRSDSRHWHTEMING